MVVEWKGTSAEQTEWEKAAARWCSCEWEEATGYRSVICPVHQAAESDQRFLDGLLWAKHTRVLRDREEWDDA